MVAKQHSATGRLTTELRLLATCEQTSLGNTIRRKVDNINQRRTIEWKAERKKWRERKPILLRKEEE